MISQRLTVINEKRNKLEKDLQDRRVKLEDSRKISQFYQDVIEVRIVTVENIYAKQDLQTIMVQTIKMILFILTSCADNPCFPLSLPETCWNAWYWVSVLAIFTGVNTGGWGSLLPHGPCLNSMCAFRVRLMWCNEVFLRVLRFSSLRKKTRCNLSVTVVL